MARKRRAAAAAEPVDEDIVEPMPATATARISQGETHQVFFEDNDELRIYEDEMRVYVSDVMTARDSSRALSPAEEEKLVRDVMRFMIFRQETKPDVPVARTELSKLFSAQRKAASGLVIKLAQERFPDAMGLEMKEIRVASAKGAAAGDEGSKYYVLRSYMPEQYRVKYLMHKPASATADRAFELTVLSLILMSGERIYEGDLWRLLEEVGVQTCRTGQEEHPVFGKPEEKIKAMIAKRYLRTLPKKSAEDTTYVWGPNAEDEITAKAVGEYIEKMLAE